MSTPQSVVGHHDVMEKGALSHLTNIKYFELPIQNFASLFGHFHRQLCSVVYIILNFFPPVTSFMF